MITAKNAWQLTKWMMQCLAVRFLSLYVARTWRSRGFVIKPDASLEEFAAIARIILFFD